MLRQMLTAAWRSELWAGKGDLSARAAVHAAAAPRAAGLAVEKRDLPSRRGQPRKERGVRSDGSKLP